MSLSVTTTTFCMMITVSIFIIVCWKWMKWMKMNENEWKCMKWKFQVWWPALYVVQGDADEACDDHEQGRDLHQVQSAIIEVDCLFRKGFGTTVLALHIYTIYLSLCTQEADQILLESQVVSSVLLKCKYIYSRT